MEDQRLEKNLVEQSLRAPEIESAVGTLMRERPSLTIPAQMEKTDAQSAQEGYTENSGMYPRRCERR
jgi:hypothetical protein